VQRTLSRLIAGPRTFNLVVSNIPGPTVPMYLLGCQLQAAYPVVPLAEHHAVSVGMITIHDQACFGVYADRQALPDADMLARDIDGAITELLIGTHKISDPAGSLLARAHAASLHAVGPSPAGPQPLNGQPLNGQVEEPRATEPGQPTR
jgi:hypothetical protein